MRHIIYFIIITFLAGCNNPASVENKADSEKKAETSPTKITGDFICKLTPEEMQLRRETVIASLKSKLIEKKELSDGYAFKFPGTDSVVDELVEFVKTERECCNFFIFNLSISGDKSESWLELRGGNGVKDFIEGELGM